MQTSSVDSDQFINLYRGLSDDAVKLEKALEMYYLRQEAFIRQRVAVLDEMQESIADERRCLEMQHQECRTQISAARRKCNVLLTDRTAVLKGIRSVKPSLVSTEEELDKLLAEAVKQREEEDEALIQVMEKRDALVKQQQQIDEQERQLEKEERNLEKTLQEIRSLNKEVQDRKQSLMKRQDSITQWDLSLEARERELVHYQDNLRTELRALERDESDAGMQKSYTTAIAPAFSQRTVMDDNDMSIDHDVDCEEIDYGDGDPS